jgi:predicted Zn-dependent peptidase
MGTAGTPAKASVRVVDRPHSVQTNLLVGALAVSRRDPDYDALLVMNQVLGAGPTGRLFVRLREEKGYTYGAFSQLITERTFGSWYARTEVGSAVSKAALRDLLHEIARLTDERVPQAELVQQERSMVTAFALTLESPQQILGYHVTRWLQQLPADYWDRLPDRVMAVRAAQVQNTARRYLDANRWHVIAVGEHDVLRDATAGLRLDVEPLDVNSIAQTPVRDDVQHSR